MTSIRYIYMYNQHVFHIVNTFPYISILGISKLYDLIKNLFVQKGRIIIRIRLDF